ncbi:MAG: hypothetical protein HY428_01130 [Candidatus Levybacteria bacterium]|nr:hypothetical protein [Candidatus Levybacteria bacterium]
MINPREDGTILPHDPLDSAENVAPFTDERRLATHSYVFLETFEGYDIRRQEIRANKPFSGGTKFIVLPTGADPEKGRPLIFLDSFGAMPSFELGGGFTQPFAEAQWVRTGTLNQFLLAAEAHYERVAGRIVPAEIGIGVDTLTSTNSLTETMQRPITLKGLGERMAANLAERTTDLTSITLDSEMGDLFWDDVTTGFRVKPSNFSDARLLAASLSHVYASSSPIAPVGVFERAFAHALEDCIIRSRT